MIVRNVFNLAKDFWFKFSYENTKLLNMYVESFITYFRGISTYNCTERISNLHPKEMIQANLG